MTAEIDHVLLTRFNLPSEGAESVIRARDGWLRQRVELFERYCLPSVRAQSTSDFHWIIYFDPASPAWLREWIEPLAASGAFTARYRRSVSPVELYFDLVRIVGKPRAALMTTNLDNDDAIATTFVERLQSVGVRERSAVYFEHGLIKHAGDLYRRVDRHNAFCSVIESWEEPSTCWNDWHNRLHLTMPVVTLAGAPGWLQVVHDTNVSNRVRGTLTAPAGYGHLFPGLLDDLDSPRTTRLLRDRLIDVPARATRESVRAGAKAAALAVLGTEGLTRAKGAIAHARGHA
jgi:hypothetical protein